MSLNAYMPFYGDDFFTAIRGYSSTIQIAYLRAIWHYWSHTHCQGLKNDSQFLRCICEVDSTEWGEVEGVVFDNDIFFCLGEDGKWHQKKASDIYQDSIKSYEAKVKAGKKGGIAKSRKTLWKTHH